MPEPVKRAAVITHGRRETVGEAIERLRAVAADFGVEPVMPADELEKHDIELAEADPSKADIVIVLGGDGTMLRALRRLLGTTVPALGVNFGTVGFLTTIPEDELESGMARVFAGDYELVELPTLEARAGEDRRDAVNDIVATSSTLGRMIELSWSVGGESLGNLRCDGLIVATPSGSTAYNLSNGGPVLVWGLDAMAVTFVAPHSLNARPLVIPRGRDVVVTNETPDVWVTALADGHVFSEIAPEGTMTIRLGPQRTLLATLPEATFFSRYRHTFAG
jgi:NAD+ kinase